ncbi:hypothetical protein BpHYR1_031302 [Brachionus plicatilis]|uniref:Uncharacterized protein n=1 Tax=Brachionus plicatilis TaxID=10195 RepID=A0A3M7T769_BRAPC|nr:hypothetical protein BpHYR1_031302 [Brachionus plicatilis]
MIQYSIKIWMNKFGKLESEIKFKDQNDLLRSRFKIKNNFCSCKKEEFLHNFCKKVLASKVPKMFFLRLNFSQANHKSDIIKHTYLSEYTIHVRHVIFFNYGGHAFA